MKKLTLITLFILGIALAWTPIYAQQAGITLADIVERFDLMTDDHTILKARVDALEKTVFAAIEKTVVPQESIQIKILILRKLRLRRGPGTNHKVMGTALAGDVYPVVGRTLNSNWWQIETNGLLAWVPAEYAEQEGNDIIPIVATPTPLASPTPDDTPTPVPTPTLESVGQEIWDRLVEIGRIDLVAAGESEVDYALDDVAAKYFEILADLEPLCEMTKIEIIDLVEPHAAKIDEAGISTRTGFWTRWSLLNGMTTYLSENEADCSEYIESYAGWIIYKYSNEDQE